MHRWDIINWLIGKYGYKTYLEIGVEKGDCFMRVEYEQQTGVDPDPESPADIHETSDVFFYDLLVDEFEIGKPHVEYDIIFIDGDHHEGQVIKDINNSLDHLAEGGTIVVHDCNPPTAQHAAEKPMIFKQRNDGSEYFVWNGTVWKAFVMTRLFRKDLQCRCVDADWGCGIIQRGEWIPYKGQMYSRDATEEHLTFPIFDKRRVEYLNLITPEAFKEIYNGPD